MNKKIYIIILFALSCQLSHAQKKPVIFTDITTKAGIDFRYNFGDYSYKNLLESSGAGITIFDYNNDRLMDIFLMNGTWLPGISDEKGKVFKNSSNKLYKNNGNGTFTDVTGQAGLAGAFLEYGGRCNRSGQGRIPGSLSAQLWSQCVLPQQWQWHFYGYYRLPWTCWSRKAERLCEVEHRRFFLGL